MQQCAYLEMAQNNSKHYAAKGRYWVALCCCFIEMSLPKSPFDDRQRRCPRLGHPVRFDYCRIGGENTRPCFKVFDCWWEQFDVVGYFKQQLTAEEFKRLACAPPPDKTASLVDLIRKAKQRIGTEK